MSLTTRDPSVIRRHIGPATQSLQNAGTLISNAAKQKSSKPKDFARKVINATNQIMPVVEGVAELHPVAKSVVSVFKAILKLETDRRDNDDRIAVVHFVMSMSVFTLEHLVKFSSIPESLNFALGETFTKLEGVINDFGNFTSVYYAHKQSLFRVMRSGDFKDKLREYSDNFNEIRTEIGDIVQMQTAITVDNINANIFKIIDTLGRENNRENAAARMIQNLGGVEAVLEDDDLLAEVAKKLGEKLNTTVRVAIHEDIDEMLEGNKSHFDKKVHGAVIQITEALESSKDAILRQLNEGPHEGIDDEDIKAVWAESKWRNSVKWRAFVDAIHDRFAQKFGDYLRQNNEYHQDQWTLMVFSKVVFHSAIGEAIDEDGSGFVSVHEVNQFLNRRPKDLFSVPEWLAFWAQGWSETNDIYRERIQELLDKIQVDAESATAENKEGIEELMGYVTAFINAIAPLQSDDDSDIFDNDLTDERYSDELERLKYEYIQLEEDRLQRKLEEFNFIIDEAATLTYVVGQPRIELSVMPLVYIWLGRVHNLVLRAQTENLEDDDFNAVSIVVTMVTILWAYTDRVGELIRVWRQQRMSISDQIHCFCGGILNAWYEESQNPDNIYRRLLAALNEAEGDEEGDEEEDEEADQRPEVEDKPNQQPKLKGDLDRKIQQLWQRMDSLDSRLGSIETLLQALVNAKTDPVNAVSNSKAVQSHSASRVARNSGTPAASTPPPSARQGNAYLEDNVSNRENSQSPDYEAGVDDDDTSNGGDGGQSDDGAGYKGYDDD